MSRSPVRIFLTERALSLSPSAVTSTCLELATFLEESGTSLADLRGIESDVLVGRSGVEWLGHLANLLARFELGWLVRGAWGILGENPVKAPLCEFSLSVRAGNCLRNAEIRTVAELAAKTEAELLHLPNMGRKSVAELRGLLVGLGLELGMDPADLMQMSQPYPFWLINLRLLQRIDVLDLPHDLQQNLLAAGCHLVGQLACIPVRQLVDVQPFCSALVQGALTAIGLDLEMSIPDWQRRHFTELRDFFEGDARGSGTNIAPAKSLQDELRLLAGLAGSEEKAQIATCVFGWDGLGGSTLEEVAQKAGWTRQWVGAIKSQVRDRAGKQPNQTPVLERALELVRGSVPCLAAEAEYLIGQEGLSEGMAFRLEGLISAATVRGTPAGFVVAEIGGVRFAVPFGQDRRLNEVIDLASGLAASEGVVSVAALLDCPAYPDVARSPSLARALLDASREVAFLDPERDWFWVPRLRSNPLLSRVRQVLNALPEVPLPMLHAALLWKEQLRVDRLPRAVLLELCRQQDWCAVNGDTVAIKDERQQGRVRESAEFKMLRILQDAGGAMHGYAFREVCIQAGIALTTVTNILAISGLIQTDNGDVIRLVGTRTSPREGPPQQKTSVVSAPSAAGGFIADSALSVLDGVVPSRDFVGEAAVRVLDFAARLGLGKNGALWSLVEIGWTKGDLQILRRWGQSGFVETRRWSSDRKTAEGLRITTGDALGLVFLAYCMDVARHDATEGEMWPQVFSSLGPTIRNSLFAGDCIARPRVREAMELACRKFHLRHVFGREGVQAWIRSVYLQFGASEAAWARLPWYLSGRALPIAITDLLRDDSALHSTSFAELWHTLQEFRWGSIGRKAAIEVITRSPWIGGIAPDHILDLAASHREIVRESSAPEFEDMPKPGQLLAPVFLNAQSDPPGFEISLSPVIPAWMSGERYVLVLGSHARLPVTRSPEGGYQIEGETAMIGATERVVAVDLLEDGVSILPDPITLELYGEDEEIAAFDLETGRKLDVWQPMPKRSCALLCAPDLKLEPVCNERRVLFHGERTLWFFRRGLPADLTLSLDGEVLWVPVEGSGPKAAKSPEYIVRCPGGLWGETVPVQLICASSIRPRKLHIGTQTIRAIPTSDGKPCFAPLCLTPDIDEHAKAVLEFISQGQLRRVPVSFEPEPNYGAAAEDNGRWQILDGVKPFDKADLHRRKLYVRPPHRFRSETPRADDWAILEGSSFCARPRGLGNDLCAYLHGMGEPLSLAVGPYNRGEHGRLPIATAVFDSGLLRSVHRTATGWELGFHQSLELTDCHAVWAMTGEAPVTVDRCAIRWFGSGCDVDKSVLSSEPLAFALAFKGCCVGTKLTEDAPHQGICELIGATPDWPRLASWLRWFQIPLLCSPIKEAIGARIAREPAETLRTWLDYGSALDSPIVQSSPQLDRWRYAIRILFESWRPSPPEAAELLQRFGLLSGIPEDDIARSWEGFEDLLDIHSVLFAHAAVEGTNHLYASSRPVERRIFLELLLNLLLDLPRAAGAGDRKPAYDNLLQQSALSMAVDPAFIERGLLRDAIEQFEGLPVHTYNLLIALAVQPLRRWLAGRLIEESLRRTQ